jgi:NTP pyrophosphatase (non-canonical NTP hydrolase)
MLKEIAEQGAPLSKPEDPIWTTTIMTYELGSLIRALVKARGKSVWNDKNGERAYLAEAKIELADLLTQGYFLAEQMGWKRLELENDGLERFRERMKELEKGK